MRMEHYVGGKTKGFTLKAPKIRIKDTPSRLKVTVLAKVK